MRTSAQCSLFMIGLSLLTGLLISNGVFASIFGYSGDGEYKSEGFFLRNHLLKLPVFSLDEVGEYTYTIEGFGNYQNLSLIVESDNAIPFWQVSTLLKVTITEKRSGKIIISKRSRLSEHFKRMQMVGKGRLKPIADEWEGRFRYSDPKINLKVTFDAHILPIEQKKVRYRHSGYQDIQMKSYRAYLVRVKIIEPDPVYKDLNAYIRITSGWK